MGLIALIKNFKRLGRKEFFKRWKIGIQKITPTQLLRTEMIGYVGTIVGSIICIIFFIWINFWVICIPISFGLLISGSSLIGKYQQYIMMKQLEKEREQHIRDMELK